MRRMEKPQAKKLLEFSKKMLASTFDVCITASAGWIRRIHLTDNKKPLNLHHQVKRSGKEVTGCHSPFRLAFQSTRPQGARPMMCRFITLQLVLLALCGVLLPPQWSQKSRVKAEKTKIFFRRLQAASATYLLKSDPDVSKPKISRG